jgi:hypothetical protein
MSKKETAHGSENLISAQVNVASVAISVAQKADEDRHNTRPSVPATRLSNFET